MTIGVSPLETIALATLRSVLTSMFDVATSVVGTVVGTTLSVGKVNFGALTPNMVLAAPGLPPGTFISGFLSGTGGVGTYSLSQGALTGTIIPVGATFTGGFTVVRGQVNRVASPVVPDYAVMWPTTRIRLGTNNDDTQDVRFVASISDSTMNVTEIDYGELGVGSILFGENLIDGTKVTLTLTGTGGIGTYQVAPAQNISSQVFAAGVINANQPIELHVQLDVHGPNSGNNAHRISTLLRDAWAVDAFEKLGVDMAPLYADDPKQIPFINDQSQYEDRWIVEACLQVNDAVTGLPQQYAESVAVGLIDVDTTYPP